MPELVENDTSFAPIASGCQINQEKVGKDGHRIKNKWLY